MMERTTRGERLNLIVARLPGNSTCRSHPRRRDSSTPPLSLGVCSWSLQVKSIPELKRLLDQLGINIVQIACGDPHHASWDEGDALPAAVRASGLMMTGAMLGFPGEDYTTPQTIKETGGFGDPAWRPSGSSDSWGLERTAGPGPDRPDAPCRLPSRARRSRAIGDAGHAGRGGELAPERGITLAFETGQETADLLRTTLDELKAPNLKVNFDPANMLLYDMGDPIRAVEILGRISARSTSRTHAGRERRPVGRGSTARGGRGRHSPIRQGAQAVGYTGPLVVEREVGDQAGRLRDVARGLNSARVPGGLTARIRK